MQAVMSKSERVFAALRRRDVDRVPVSAWWHDYEREWSAGGLAEATLEAYRKYDWDFVKINPRATYYAEDWGASFQRRPGRQPEVLKPAVTSPADLQRIEPLDVREGAYGEQLEAVCLVRDRLAGEAPFIQTVFSPLAVISRMTGSTAYVQRLIRQNPQELRGALDAVAQTLSSYAREALNAGAGGIFFATVEWGSSGNIPADQYETFARPYDLRVLEAVRDAPFNVLHVCRDNNHLLRLLDYPVAAFHWDNSAPGNPSLRDIASRTGAAVMGGVSHDRTIATGRPEDVFREVRSAAEETGGKGFLAAPACSIEPDTPEANIRALVKAVRE